MCDRFHFIVTICVPISGCVPQVRESKPFLMLTACVFQLHIKGLIISLHGYPSFPASSTRALPIIHNQGNCVVNGNMLPVSKSY